jgi:hypothetical protein
MLVAMARSLLKMQGAKVRAIIAGSDQNFGLRPADSERGAPQNFALVPSLLGDQLGHL